MPSLLMNIHNLLQGEIRATGFNDVVDKFYEILEVNKVCDVKAGSFHFLMRQCYHIMTS